MHRRQFLGLLAALAAAGAAGGDAVRRVAAQTDRSLWWSPAPGGTLPPNRVVLEWRYLAGRISEAGQDVGFVVSLADFNAPFVDPPQLLVMREDLAGATPHRAQVYPGSLTYDAASATYRFAASSGAAAATWRFDSASQRYTLSVVSPELELGELTLIPQGALIPEAGTGQITTATFGGVDIFSDYYADWVTISRGGANLGVGRLDMQSIRPAAFTLPTGFSHHWFAVAAESEGAPVWLSAWRLVSERSFWVVTIARNSGASWSVESFTERTPDIAYPLSVEVRDWQPQPVADGEPPRRTGRRWLLSAGRSAPGDLLNLVVSVAPGQFISGARVGAGLTTTPLMQEAVGNTASGSLQGVALGPVRLVVAESTFSELAGQRLHLPVLRQ